MEDHQSVFSQMEDQVYSQVRNQVHRQVQITVDTQLKNWVNDQTWWIFRNQVIQNIEQIHKTNI